MVDSVIKSVAALLFAAACLTPAVAIYSLIAREVGWVNAFCNTFIFC